AEEQYTSALAVARARRDLPRQAALSLNLGALAHGRGDAARADAWYAAAEEAWRLTGRERDALGVALNRAVLAGTSPEALRTVQERAREAGAPDVAARAALGVAMLHRRTDPAAARAAADEAL